LRASAWARRRSQETQRHRENQRRGKVEEAQALILSVAVISCFLCVSVSPVIRLFSAFTAASVPVAPVLP
jgi:hypothetical protein